MPVPTNLRCAVGRDFGLPRFFLTPLQAAYRGGVAFDPARPPLFEAEAAYLARHGLLTPAERARLTVADFAPQAVEVDR
jgi:hypothetical protein